MHFSLRPLAILALGSTLAACSGTMPRWTGVGTPESTTDPQAEALLRSGNYEGAMQRYEWLARTASSPDAYWVRAADAALRAGDGQAAEQLASAINPRNLDTLDRNQYLLLSSRLDLNAGRAKDAMSKLNSLSGASLEAGQAVNYHTLRASAFNQLGDMLGSARERVALGKLLSQPDAIKKNDDAIYDALGRLPTQALTDRAPPPPDTLGGWMALARILKTTPPKKLSAAVTDWRRQYPRHPADGAFVQEAVAEKGGTVEITPLASAPIQAPLGGTAAATATSTAAATTPATPNGPFVGVLLPLSGAYAPAAQAIKAGMTAAYFADTNPSKPKLQFVDSEAGDIYQAYRTMADQGAMAVVGPLVKENIVTLAGSGALLVPVLALNQTPVAQSSQLYQFGLTPEHEVEQAAGSAWFDGKQTALVLAPSSPFGDRMVKHFSSYWKKLGGRIAASKTYAAHGADFSGSVQALTNALQGTPDAGSTANFVFLIADAKDAHQLMPQIAKSAGPLPVYATSHVFNGKVDGAADLDLSGLIFCDMPWLLNPSDGGALSANALQAQVQQTPPDYVKLIALGLDAYRLVPELGRFKADPRYRFSGATGSLSLQSGNRLQRQLECAQFEGGSLQARGIAPLLQPGAPVPANP
jgi:outer membrane PBP1 activator LpoA protein